VALRVVDDLSVDVLRRAMHGQARTTATNLLEGTADALRALLDCCLVGHVFFLALKNGGDRLR
jgi:hypothetical protein